MQSTTISLRTYAAIVRALAQLDPTRLVPATWAKREPEDGPTCACALGGIALQHGWQPEFTTRGILIDDAVEQEVLQRIAALFGLDPEAADDNDSVPWAIVGAFDRGSEPLTVAGGIWRGYFAPETWTINERLTHVLDELASRIDPDELLASEVPA